MSKADEEIKRRSRESPAFKEAYENEKLTFNIADLMYDLRAETGLNQTDFAKKVSKPRSTIARIENATMEPSLTLIQEIAQALGKHIVFTFVDNEKTSSDLIQS